MREISRKYNINICQSKLKEGSKSKLKYQKPFIQQQQQKEIKIMLFIKIQYQQQKKHESRTIHRRKQYEFFKEINNLKVDSIEFDQSKDNCDSKDIENQNIPQTDILEVQQNGMSFQAFSECDFLGISYQIWGPNQSIPKELWNLIQSIIIPKQMRIAFYKKQQSKSSLKEIKNACKGHLIMIDLRNSC
ncbi:unnamed protein product (macronuclear) [Paramecium tetraurelia]|uniref:Uncharacterized protein n=1 Tax=Paramecium tetraurelia TaxID=5888 RepID=A0D2Q3_PARTE|nr:uncharacterized protein GSPATT00012828001 [Paramecium tetraurelia]CAK77320.1 unnamed protein product [Paramecium tetraurelia]|eukprot:XP_001444717.1 hypothetical protein (macronuclear) [Paramecium tetraurelia strain d4-2]